MKKLIKTRTKEQTGTSDYVTRGRRELRNHFCQTPNAAPLFSVQCQRRDRLYNLRCRKQNNTRAALETIYFIFIKSNTAILYKFTLDKLLNNLREVHTTRADYRLLTLSISFWYSRNMKLKSKHFKWSWNSTYLHSYSYLPYSQSLCKHPKAIMIVGKYLPDYNKNLCPSLRSYIHRRTFDHIYIYMIECIYDRR